MEFDELLVRSFEHWDLYLHQRQVYLGRCYLELSGGFDIDPFTDCDSEEWSSLLYIVKERINPALYRLWQPDSMDYACLRSVSQDCHWQLAPRYNTDRVFAGHRFVDDQGNNLGVDNQAFTDEILIAVRDALRAEIG
jgi:hypothetical protein